MYRTTGDDDSVQRSSSKPDAKNNLTAETKVQLDLYTPPRVEEVPLWIVTTSRNRVLLHLLQLCFVIAFFLASGSVSRTFVYFPSSLSFLSDHGDHWREINVIRITRPAVSQAARA